MSTIEAEQLALLGNLGEVLLLAASSRSRQPVSAICFLLQITLALAFAALAFAVGGRLFFWFAGVAVFWTGAARWGYRDLLSRRREETTERRRRSSRTGAARRIRR